VCYSVFVARQKLATHGFVRGEDVLGLPSGVDFALLYFVHGFDISLKFGGECGTCRRDIRHDQIFDGIGGESWGERDRHGNFATPDVV
jgi:hypothetical protein